MTKHYNKKSVQGGRRYLRSNMTYVERQVWSQLRRRQLGVRFLRQYSIDQYVVDFYSPEIKLAVEIDGVVHMFKRKKDKDRQSYLESFGITFVRIDNEEFMAHPNKSVEKIESEIKTLLSKKYI